MSTVPPEASSTADEPLANIPFDYPGADIILRSQDSHHFQVPKTFIANNSPVLGGLIQRTLDSPGDPNAGVSLPVVQLPDSGDILRHLLTFIFPVTPTIPSTHEEAMELLSVAQKYQMATVLIHIRGSVARQNPLPTHLEPALRIYSLAQKYGLRQEALQTARNILQHSMTVENFDNMLDLMPGASLYELWKYYEVVRAILASDLTEFRGSVAHGPIQGIRCIMCNPSQVPSWIDDYIESIARTPNLFDLVEFNTAMSRHIKATAAANTCECASIPSQTIRKFWEALAFVVHGSYDKAESFLSLVHEQQEPQPQINPTTSPPPTFDVPDANIIIRSSDLVDFRVHKSVLVMTSPFFKDLLSLPQPSDSETFDGLPVVRLSEDSGLLNSLVSILYPVRTVIPSSYKKVLYLLAACQKYDMVSVQSLIRAEVSRGEFPAPKGAEAFAAYVIASRKGLIPEMENAARQTLEHPMTFGIFGEELQWIEGWALRDLANFRKRCRDSLVACFQSFLQLGQPPFNIWIPCGDLRQSSRYYSLNQAGASPPWLTQLFQNRLIETRDAFSKPFFNPRSIRGEYLSAINAHNSPNICISCTNMHARKGEAFCKELENKLTQALDEVRLDTEAGCER